MAVKVLVVDDLLPNIKLLEAKLEGEYYDVLTAQSGKEALKILETQKPDIILLDVMMPEMDGFETCKRIKANAKTSDIPVVIVTALSEVDDRVEGLNSGADDFLTKPINDLALFARIRSLVRLKNMTDELINKNGDTENLPLINELRRKTDDITDSTVLIIDNDVAEAQQIANKLKKYNLNVTIKTKPKEGIKETEDLDVDLIIVAAHLEGDDGLHLCSHFRSLDRTKLTPLLIIIEDDEMDLLVKGFDIGINDYLISPIDGNEVLARVRTQIRRKKYQDVLRESQQKNLSLALNDKLTGVYNRHYFDTHMQNLIEDSDSNKNIALLLLDIDHFKKVNDTYGHLSGDEVLKQLTPSILKNIRSTDLCARYGGEEFIIVLTDASITEASKVAERIRRTVESYVFTIPEEPKKINCTVSIGVSAYSKGDKVNNLIEKADKALYHVKNTGRNKVAVFE